MLEGVSVDIAFAQRFVRQYVVVKGDQLDVQTIFLFGDFFGDFSNLLFRTHNHAHFNMVRIFFFLTATCQGQRAEKGAYCRKGFKLERHNHSLTEKYIDVVCNVTCE
ncbi:hypothetical protein BN132_95 [Cronobacter turicensis 564]|nr:hypothetical protein BN132_95 [Cronobacter turicensis 564]